MTAKKRPDTLAGRTHKIKTNCGNFYLTLNTNEDELYEVKMDMGKSGNCVKGMLSAISILYSVLLQLGATKEILVKTIKRHLLGVSCGEIFYHSGKPHKSCLDWAAKEILKELKAEIKDGIQERSGELQK